MFLYTNSFAFDRESLLIGDFEVQLLVRRAGGRLSTAT